MTAEAKKAVINTGWVNGQALGKQLAQLPLLRSSGRHRGEGGKGRLRQRPAVNFAIRRQGEVRQHHHPRGHHIVRQFLRRCCAQRIRATGCIIVRHDVRHQPFLPALFLLMGDDQRLFNVGQGVERVFNLPEFNTIAADLDLIVHPAEENDCLRFAPAGHIAGAIHPLTLLIKRVGNKALAG